MQTLNEDSFDEPLDIYTAYRVEYVSVMGKIRNVLHNAGRFTGRK